ncbi:MAG: AzlD domain-containing protein [Acholeplasmatales bacterium]|nr:AzlD domain-containing protein [Acholeplasmatales bacterium]
MYNVICLIIMALVTYIPRALPLALFNKKIENRFIKSFLFYVPYAVLAAMTFPFILYFVDEMWIAAIGTGVALILAFFRQKLIIVALISVLVVFILLLIF